MAATAGHHQDLLAKHFADGASLQFQALVAQEDGCLALRDVLSGACVRRPEGFSTRLHCLACDWASMRVASSGASGSLHIWDLSGRSSEEIMPSTPSRSCIRALAADWKLGRCVSGSDAGELSEWDLDGKLFKQSFRFRLSMIFALSIDWARFRSLVGHGEGGIDYLDLEDGVWLRSLAGLHNGVISALVVGWNKARALVGSGDGVLCVWDVRKGVQVQQLEGHTGGICALAMRWAKQRAVSGATDRTCRLWDLKRGCCLAVVPHDGPVRALSVDWEANVALSADGDGDLRFWTLISHKKEMDNDETERDGADQHVPVQVLSEATCGVGAAISALSLQPRSCAPQVPAGE